MAEMVPLVSIGVPVFNGGEYLAECLECLRTQTFKEIEVLIFDNASTDDTAAIAAEFCARDPRFQLTRQKENLGATKNFMDALRAARAPYFMWRAHDDLSDAGYVEVLYGLLSKRPDAGLAVGAVSTMYADGRQQRLALFPKQSGAANLTDTARLLFNSHASWFYGLWRRDLLETTFRKVWDTFPHAWGSDHLTLFPSLLGGSVTGSNDVQFIQRIRSISRSGRRQRESISDMMRLRSEFRRACDRFMKDCELPASRRIMLRGLLPLYVDRRAYSLSKLVRRSLLLSAEKVGGMFSKTGRSQFG